MLEKRTAVRSVLRVFSALNTVPITYDEIQPNENIEESTISKGGVRVSGQNQGVKEIFLRKPQDDIEGKDEGFLPKNVVDIIFQKL